MVTELTSIIIEKQVFCDQIYKPILCVTTAFLDQVMSHRRPYFWLSGRVAMDVG